jgi:basic membrane protein A
MQKKTLGRALAGAVAAGLALSVVSLTGPAASAASKIVGIAFDLGGKEQPGFNQLAYIGFKTFAKTHPGWTEKDLQGNGGDTDASRAQRLKLLVKAGCNPIVVVGYSYTPALKIVAAANPTVKFSLVDDSFDAPNVEGLLFHAEEGSYLVGMAAALTTKTNSVGFIGGVNIPLIQAFEAGFKAGVYKVNPKIKYQSTYASNPPDFSGFNAPDKGHEAALGMFQNGADVVYSAAGSTGQGAHKAAFELGKGHWSIGVDADEALFASNAKYKSVILTSALKNVDAGVNSFLSDVVGNTFTPGAHYFDASNGGVGFTTTGNHLSAATVAKLNTIKYSLASGAIVVPTDPKKVTLPQG